MIVFIIPTSIPQPLILCQTENVAAWSKWAPGQQRGSPTYNFRKTKWKTGL